MRKLLKEVAINIQSIKINFIVLVMFTIALITSQFHSFSLWPQVTELRGSSINYIDILSQAHFLRYLLVLPIFKISDLLSADADFVFKIVCFFNLILITINCSNILKFYRTKNQILVNILFSFFFIFLSAFMNGRIIFSFLGFSYFLLAIHQWELYKISNLVLLFKILIGLFLSSVSTGTFLSTTIVLCAWLVLYQGKPKGFLSLYIFITLLLISPILTLYLLKNVNYYGGGFSGFINMLDHGIGVIFLSVTLDILILMLMIIFMLGVIFLPIYLKSGKYKLLILVTISTLFAGLFGFSTLTLSIVPMTVLILLFLLNQLTSIFPLKNA